MFNNRRRRYRIAAATVALPLIGAAYAADFGTVDVGTIINTYRQNEPKFKRDFVGKTFSGAVRFSKAGSSIFGTPFVHFGDEVMCLSVSTSENDKVANWNLGDTIKVEGTIYDVTLGTLQLKQCSFHT